MKYKSRRTLIVLIALVSIVLSQLINTATPFYAREYASANEAVDAAKNMEMDRNIMTLNTDLKAVFVEDTSIALVKDGKNFTAQGHYYVDGNTGKVIYCLDPTILVGNKVDYQKLESEGKHTLYSFDKETQAKIVAVGYAANELYSKTSNEQYLLLGQYLTWDLSGSDLLYYDDSVAQLMPELKKLADEKISEISQQMDKYVTLLDTSGQDLIEISNAPVVDLSRPELKLDTKNDAPTIYAFNKTYDAGELQAGETLIDVTKLTAKFFDATAIDAEDGNLTNKINVDYSAVDASKPGVYNVVLKVTDSKGQEVSTTVKLILTNNSTSVDENYLLHGNDITTDDKKLLDLGAPYQKAANVYAQDLEGKKVAVNSKEVTRQIYTSNDEGMTELTIEKVKNSTKTTKVLAQDNYIYYVEDLSTLDGSPLLYADNLILNVGDKYTTDLFKASAFDVDRHVDITSSIKFSGGVDTSKVGVYQVKISVKDTDGDTTTITRYVTVKGDDSVVNPNETMLLDASDIYTNESSIEKLDDINAFILKQANAHAFSLVDGSDLPVNVQSTTLNIDSKAGVYNAIITTTDGTEILSKPINIFVANDGDVVDKNKPYITAQNIKVNLNDTVSKIQYKAYAFDRQDGNLTDKIVYPTVDTSTVGPKRVTLSITDSDKNRADVDVVASVVDEDTITDPDDKVALYGVDVETDILTLAEFTTQKDVDEYLLAQSKAFAFDMITGEILNVKVTNSDVTTTATAGVYTIKISVDANGVTVDKEIKVTVKDAEMLIEAKDIVTNEDSLRAIDSEVDLIQSIINQSEAKAIAKVRDLKVDFSVNLNGFTTESTVGTYPIEISATNGVVSASTTINVNVLNDGDVYPDTEDSPYLYGESILVKAGDTIDNDDYHGYAYDNQDGDLTTRIEYPTIDTSIEGAHQAQLSVTDNDGNTSQIDVVVYIDGENTEIGDEGEVLLTAYDIFTNENELGKQLNLEKFIVETSRAQAYDMLTDKPLEITVDLKDLTTSSTAGIYQVELTAANETDTATSSINVYVANDGETIDDEKPYISADNITAKIGDGYSTELFNAVAFDRQDGDLTDRITYPDVTAILDSENKFDEFGVYKFDIRVTDANGNVATKQVTITVLDDDAVITPDKDMVLRATDIYTNENSISSQTNITDFILRESSAQAFLTESGLDISSEIFVEATNLSLTSTKGVYSATITVKYDIDDVEKTLSKSIDIYVAEGSEEVDTENPYLAGDNIVVQLNEKVTGADFNAVAFDVKDGDLTHAINYNLPVDTTEPGVFTHQLAVTDADGNSTEDTVTVTVLDEDSVISPDEKVMLHAADITTNEFTLKNYKSSVEQFIVENADAFAFNAQNGARVTPVVDSTDLTLTSTYGTYTATLSAKVGTSTATKTIKIFVANDGDVIPTDGTPYLTGENVKLKIGDTITDDAFNAYAADEKDGDITADISYPSYADFADSSNVTNKVGAFKVELKVTNSQGNETTKQLLVVVTSDDSVIDPTEKYMIDAKDIYTNETSVPTGDASDFILTQSEAQAFNLETGAELSVIVKSTDLEAKVGVYTATVEIESPAGVLSKDIKIYVAKGSDEIDSEKPYIYADNISVNLSDETVDSSLYNAVAFDRQDGDLTSDIEIPDFTITERGVFANTLSVTDSDGNESTKDVTVTVLDGSEIIIPDLDMIIYADDIFTNVDSVKAATDINQFIIDNANVAAYKMSTGENLTDKIKVDSETLSKLVGAGIADAVFQVGTNASAQAPIDIYVANGADVVDDNDPYITSGNLTLEIGQEFKLSALKPIAFDRQDGDITDDITNSDFTSFVDDDNLADTIGVHTVTFTVVDSGDNTSSNNSFVTVSDPDTTVIDDNLMIVSLNNLTTTTLAMANVDGNDTIKTNVLTQSNAVAYDMLDGSLVPVTVTNLNGLVKGATAGDYDVTITAEKGDRTVSKPVTVTVEDLDVVLTANNIYTNEDEFAKVSTTVNEWILDQSEASAENGDGTSTSISVTVKTTDITADSTAGRYTATIEATNGVETTTTNIRIIVVPGSEVVPDEDPYLTASNIKVEQNAVVTASQFKGQAEDRQDGDITTSIDYNLPVDTSEVGVFEHTLSVTDSDGNETTKTVLVTVTNSGTVISPDEKLLLYAEDVYTNVSALKANSSSIEDYLKTTANAVAYKITDGTNITDDITISDNTVVERAGIYSVTFNVTSTDSTPISKTVDVYVAEGTVDPTAKPYVYGDNIIKNVGDTFDVADLNAFAFDDEIGDLTDEIEFDTTDVSLDSTSGTDVYDAVGVYEVIAKVTYGGVTSTHTSYISVIDDETVVDPTEKVMIRAVDFTDTELGVNANLDDLNGYVKIKAEAVAYNMTDGSSVAVNVTSNPVTDTADEYTVSFAATVGGITVNKNVTATITDSNVVIDAEEIFTNEDTVNALSDEEIAMWILVQSNARVQNNVATIDVNDVVTNLVKTSTYGEYAAMIFASNAVDTGVTTVEIHVAEGGNVIPDEVPYITSSDSNGLVGDTFAKESMKLYAYDRKDGDLTDDIAAKLTNKYADGDVMSDFGVFPMTYNVVDSDAKVSSTTSNLTVTRDGTVINDKAMIDGNDVFTSETVLAEKITDDTVADFIIAESKAAGYKLADGEVGTITVDTTDIEAEAGVYDVTYVATFTDKSTISIDKKVFVTKDADVTPDEAPYVTADDLTVNVGDAVTNAMFNVIAFDRQDGEDVTVVIGDYSTATIGVFEVPITATDSDGNKTEITSTLIVKDESSEIENDLMLSYDDISTNTNALALETDLDEFILSESNANAWDILESTNVTNKVTVAKAYAYEEDGVYDATSTPFTLASGVGIYRAELTANSVDETREMTREVFIYVGDGDDVIPDDAPYVTMSNVVKNVGDTIANADYHVVYFDKQDKLDLTVEYPEAIDTSYAHVERAEVTVTDSDRNGSTATSSVVIKGEDSVYEDDILLSGSDFEIADAALVEVTNIDQMIKDNGNVTAYDALTGEELTVALTHTITSTSTPGEYTVKLKATSGDNSVEKEITVTITDLEIDIDAKSIYTNEETVATLTTDEAKAEFIIRESEAKGMYKAIKKVEVQSTNMALTAGEYTATLFVTDRINEATKDIKIIVLPGDEVIDENGLWMDANNVSVKVGETVTNDMFGAYGYDQQEDGKITSFTYPDSYDTSKMGISNVTITGNGLDGTGRSVSKDVKLIVLNDGAVTSGDVSIYGHFIKTNTDEVSTLTSSSINKWILDNSEATAIDLETTDNITPTVKSTTLTPTSTVGVYAATLKATNGTDTAEITIPIYVANGSDNIVDGETYIYAENGKTEQEDDGTVGLSIFNAVAMNTETGNRTSSITPTSFSINEAGVFKHTLTVDGASKAVVLTVTGEDSVIKDNLFINGNNVYTNEEEIATVSNIKTFIKTESNAKAYNMTTGDALTVNVVNTDNVSSATKRGVYSVDITAQKGTTTVSKTLDFVVLPNSDVMPENESYIYADDVQVERDGTYNASMHNAFGYDKGTGKLNLSDLDVTGADRVDVSIGERYPVKFSFVNRNGETIETDVVAEVLMPAITTEAKVNAMNLDFKGKVDASAYSSESRFKYKFRVREGADLNSGNVIYEAEYNTKSSPSTIYSLSGSTIGWEPNKEYNLGFYEIGTGRDYYIDGFSYTTPNIDPGPDGQVYSCGAGDLSDACSGDNISYIDSVYQLESIGYEENPQPNRVEFLGESSDPSRVDLTVAKYERTYRPFGGNYRLSSDIDASATQNDTKPDAQGGFGTDGFKPIGYTFTTDTAYSSGGANSGRGFYSQFADSFTGQLDGNGYKISNLYINRYTESLDNQTTGNIGIFGRVGGDNTISQLETMKPNITNLTIKDANIQAEKFSNVGSLVGENTGRITYVTVESDITGYRHVGGILGKNGFKQNDKDTNGLIENSRFDGRVQSTYVDNYDTNVSGAGGIVGRQEDNSVTRYNTSSGYIDGDDNTGGIVGRNWSGIVTQNYSDMTIEGGSNSIGGIVGYSTLTTSSVNNNQYNGTVIFSNNGGYGYYFGGIIGWNDGSTSSNNIATGNVIGGYANTGGAIGYNNNYRANNNVVLGSKIRGIRNAGSAYVSYAARSDGYYTPNTQVLKLNGSNGVNLDYGAKEAYPSDMRYTSWWTDKGYEQSKWDMSGLSSGLAPKLVNGEGKVLPNQADISLDTDPATVEPK